MKRKTLLDSEKTDILRRLAQTPRLSQEVVAEETHHRKAKIKEVLEGFQRMPWEKAQALCGNDQQVLKLREDYVERKIAEAKDYEEGQRMRELALRHELGLPLTYHYMKDGHWVMEF